MSDDFDTDDNFEDAEGEAQVIHHRWTEYKDGLFVIHEKEGGVATFDMTKLTPEVINKLASEGLNSRLLRTKTPDKTWASLCAGELSLRHGPERPHTTVVGAKPAEPRSILRESIALALVEKSAHSPTPWDLRQATLRVKSMPRAELMRFRADTTVKKHMERLKVEIGYVTQASKPSGQADPFAHLMLRPDTED